MTPLLYVLVGVLLTAGFVVLRRRYAAFYGQKPSEYAGIDPVFDLQERLNGPMLCEGVIYGPLGRVSSTFAADFNISWNGAKGIMDEVFRYNDGSTQVRQWQIKVGAHGVFDLQASDVPGGGQGVMRGNAIQMRYPIKLPDSAGGHVLNCVDWMYLTPDGTVMNRSQFRKFGFKVAELIATIRPKGDV